MSWYTLLDAHQCSDRTHPFLIPDLLPNMTYQWTFKTWWVTRWVLHVEKELLTLPEHFSSPSVLVGFISLDFQFSVQCFVDHCLSFCDFFFILTIALLVLRFTISNYPFGTFTLSNFPFSINFRIQYFRHEYNFFLQTTVNV